MSERARAQRLLPLLAILLLALALAVYRSDVQSFWSDEGNSVAMAPRAVPDIIERSANDISPPLYYLAIRGWAGAVGTSEMAIRALSALATVLTVALTAALGQRIGGRGMAVTAALAAALSPLAIHYAQEARMYAMVTTLGAATWGLLLLPARGRRALLRDGAYVLLVLAMFWSQYFTVAIPVAQNAAWLAGGRRAWRQWRRWFLLQGLVAALYLPWFLRVRRGVLGWPALAEEFSPAFFLRDSYRILLWGAANEGMPLWAALGYGALLVVGVSVGLLAVRRSSERAAVRLPLSPRAVPLFYGLGPPLLMLLLSLDRPFYDPKFLLIALPGLHLLLGQGVVQLATWAARAGPRPRVAAGSLLLTFLALAPATPLHNEYWEPVYWRDDYRAIARTIAARAGAEDGVLLSGPGQSEIFDYYFDDPLAVYPLPESRPLDPSATTARLEEIARRHPRLFAVWWAEEQQDPARLIPTWLEAHAFEAGSRWYGNVRLATYRLAPAPPPTPLRVPFGTALELRAVGADPLQVVAGDVIAVESRWQRQGNPEAPVTFFAQLLDEGQQIAGQYDGDGGAPPAAEWEEGSEVTVRMGVTVAPGAAPGRYRLIVGAYRSDSGVRFGGPEGDSVQVAEIEVTKAVVPPDPLALGLVPGELRDTRIGSARVVGARLHPVGLAHAPESPMAAGAPFNLVLFWQADEPGPTLPPLELHLETAAGVPVTTWPYLPLEGRYPPTAWTAGEVVRDPQLRFLPAALPAGGYRLWLQAGKTRLLVGPLQVAP